MKKLLFLLFPILIFGADLKSLIAAAQKSEQAVGYELEAQAKEAQISAVKRAYLPKITAGYTMQQVDQKGAFDPGETRVASIGAKAVLFDGFMRENMIDEKEMEHSSAVKRSAYFKKVTALNVAGLYFSILNTQEDLRAKEQKAKQLDAEVERLQKFYDAGSVSLDSVEKIKASNAMNQYEIQMIAMNLESLKFKLQNITCISADELEPAAFEEPFAMDFKERDDLLALKDDIKALEFRANQADSEYLPVVFIEDRYSNYEYSDFNPLFPMVENQNKITLGVSMTLFDFFSKSKEAEAIELNAKKLKNSHQFLKREAEHDLKLAAIAIKAAKKKIEAAKSRVTAADKTYELVSKKFQANIVDNVTYLDALSEKYAAQALYRQSLNNYEYEKAAYYFYAAKDIKEFIQ